KRVMAEALNAEMFDKEYSNVFTGNEMWNQIPKSGGELYQWDELSTYIQEPPFFAGLSREVKPISNINGARVLVKVGDSITTDHISPAGSISRTSPAAQYLTGHDVELRDFNSYGSRRGNDRVMTRGTFANIRLRNQMAPGTEGGMTTYLPTGEVMTIYDASLRYKEADIPLVALAGREYGTGSSRDWAAKGPLLLGIHMVIAESFERIHRSNLVGMGILPLQYKPGENADSLGLDGTETFATLNLDDNLKPGQTITVSAIHPDGRVTTFDTICRIDTPVEVGYYRNGGILHTVLRNFLAN
ncbi:MAG: aconitate hydratase, partial [Anaerolineae bacterium]